jgi:hypothetical protein
MSDWASSVSWRLGLSEKIDGELGSVRGLLGLGALHLALANDQLWLWGKNIDLNAVKPYPGRRPASQARAYL